MTSPVDRARELLEGITPGPWHAIQSPRSCEFVSSVWAPNDHQVARMVEHMEQNVSQEHRDAVFIAAAPDLVRDLLAEVGRLEATLRALRIDCGSHSCMFAQEKGGMRVNGLCQCLESVRPTALRLELTRTLRAVLRGPADGRDE